ncbi:hypothetical protein DVH24_014221 [Malus domestica]|uniref:Uncharacterized protein n=1 Tax=Malus domestica TaxID=3750 RepID=A0A498JFM2_MALDO|nr:hypothetical protein DVH24_014221 [Malus domestica]
MVGCSDSTELSPEEERILIQDITCSPKGENVMRESQGLMGESNVQSENFGKMQISCDWEGNIILIYFSKQFTYLHFSALCVKEVSSVSVDLEMYGASVVGFEISVVHVKFTSQDSCDNAYFSLKALLAELPG